jgi:hypothetical protein
MMLNKLGIIQKCLEKERKDLVNAIDKLVIARDESPLLNETRSDTSRIQADKMLSALKDQLVELDKLIHNLPKKIEDSEKIDLWNYVELINNEIKLKLILVPEGYGGREIEGIKLISITTPLAKTLNYKSLKNDVTVNNSIMTILLVQ